MNVQNATENAQQSSQCLIIQVGPSRPGVVSSDLNAAAARASAQKLPISSVGYGTYAVAVPLELRLMPSSLAELLRDAADVSANVTLVEANVTLRDAKLTRIEPLGQKVQISPARIKNLLATQKKSLLHARRRRAPVPRLCGVMLANC